MALQAVLQPEPGEAQRAVGGAGAMRKVGGGAVTSALASFSFIITRLRQQKPERKPFHAALLAGFGSSGNRHDHARRATAHGDRGQSLAVARVC